MHRVTRVPHVRGAQTALDLKPGLRDTFSGERRADSPVAGEIRVYGIVRNC